MGMVTGATRAQALVFDIETIADLTPENRGAIAALAKGRQMTAEQYGAFCAPLARVICVAWCDVVRQKLGVCLDGTLHTGDLAHVVEVEDEVSAATGRTPCEMHRCDGEAEVLRNFGGVVDQHCRRAGAQLVTYNGRGFDLPVLVHRSIKHRVTEGRELLSKAALENRYRPSLHLDLMDVVTFYGAAPRWPMAAYAIGYGFRSPKNDMDGSQVWAAVQAGRIVDVARYCAGDVLAAVHIYQCVQGTPPAKALRAGLNASHEKAPAPS
ncbi:MAG: ribonuclease H-like domain-containing protein [Candidatus Binatia bacterium]